MTTPAPRVPTPLQLDVASSIQVILESCRNFLEAHETGSRVICNPPPMDTDRDVIIFVADLKNTEAILEESGGDLKGCAEYATDPESGCDPFISARFGALNLIITQDDDFYRRFLAATHIATQWNMREKKDRIALFQAVLYGNCPLNTQRDKGMA